MTKKILLITGICLALAVGAVVCLFVAFFVSMERGEEHQRQLREEQRSGKWDFGDQPALFAVAQGIVKNDPDAIRAAAKGVPDLQAPGRDGATLLYFAVTQSWQRPELVESVRTLLSLGADPNYTNGKRDSFAMTNAVHASAPVLRAMLEAGGNPNTRNEFGRWTTGRIYNKRSKHRRQSSPHFGVGPRNTGSSSKRNRFVSYRSVNMPARQPRCDFCIRSPS